MGIKRPIRKHAKFMKVIPEGSREQFKLAEGGEIVVAAESQYDPGIFRLMKAPQQRFGTLLVLDDVEYWCVETDYQPASSTLAKDIQSLWDREETDIGVLPDVSFRCHRIDVSILVEPNISMTGQGGATPNTPHLFAENRYGVFQSGRQVGTLIVEHAGSNKRTQYWFLYTVATASTGVYVFPGKGAGKDDITNRIAFESAYTANMSLATFRATLPQHFMIVGDESFHSTIPGN
jgi:hypothetical protein